MAVFDRQYQPWEGVRTGRLERLLVMPRYSYRGLFASKLFTGFFSAAFIPALIGAGYIWIRNNLPMLQKLGADTAFMPDVDGRFFLFGLYLQLCFAAVLTLLQGPALVSPDLVNGALPLYLSRPVTRTQYVLGKFLVLALLLSAITWVPLAALFFLQGLLVSEPWMLSHLRLLVGVVAGSFLAIVIFSLVALAISAWVKSKAIARAFMVFFIIVPAISGEAFNALLETNRGHVLNLITVLESLSAAFLGVPLRASVPLANAVTMLVFIVVGALLLLKRRLRAFETVKG